jgi:hypothetical protein
MEIHKRINNWWLGQGLGGGLRLIVHSDNERPHTGKLLMDFMDDKKMTRAPHSRYSLDLTPSDFFQLGDVNRQFSGCFFNDANDLFTAFKKFWTVLKNLR